MLCVGLLVALGIAFAFTLSSGTGATTAAGRVGGDYPSFYGAGRIAAAGDWDELYSSKRLEAAQADLFPADDQGGYIAFPYPPYVAAAYRPLAAIPYRASYTVHTALMVAALVLAMQLIRPMVRAVNRNPLVATTLALAFFPMFRGITGGQNTALTLLLFAASWRFVHDDRDLLAGVALGLMLYKPQYAVPLLALHLVGRRWRVLPGFVAMGALAWAMSTLVAGSGWTGDWIDALGRYGPEEAKANATNAISWLGGAEAILDPGTIASFIGWSLALVTGVLLAWLWWGRGRRDLAVPMAAASAGVLLASPHAVFYDAGLIVVAGAVLADRGEGRWVAALWLLGATHVLNDALGVSPLVLVIAAALAVTARSGVRQRPQRAPADARSTP
jgi:hypothetical protein